MHVVGLRWLLPLLALLVLGCASHQPITYDSVKREFPLSGSATPSRAEGAAPVQGQTPGASGPQRDWRKPLSLAEAVRLSLAYNPEQEMAWQRVRQAEAMLDQSLAAFLPMISLYTEYARGDVPSGYLFKTIDQRLLPPNTNFNDPGTFQNWESGVRVRWNLFRGGQDYLRRRMAAEGLEMGRLDRATLNNTLTASVIKGYYNCLAANDMVAISRQAVQSVEAQLRQTQVRYEGGGALKSDVLSLRVRLAQAREDLVRSENGQRLALAALANLLGADPDTDLVLVGEEKSEPRVPREYAQGVLEAMSRRPELAGVRHQVVGARLALAAARAEYLPRVDAQGSVSWDDPLAQYSGERTNWTAGAVASWDVFTGLSTLRETQKARAALLEVLAADRKAALGVQLDVKGAYLNLAEALARLEVSRASVDQASESLKLVSEQYQGGAADVTRFLDTELNLSSARARQAAARHDARKARADVARALGMFCDPEKLEWAGHE